MDHVRLLLVVLLGSAGAAGYADLFDGENYDGASFRCAEGTRYKGADLGVLSDTASSLRVQGGFMVTVAVNEDGTGPSEVFVANDGTLEVQLAQRLNNKVSFVRVVAWRNPGKKGWAGGGGGQVAPTWYYNWNKGEKSKAGREYVPMQWGSWGQPTEDGGLYKQKGVTALLGFNEPDSKDQANMGVEKALQIWPKLTAAGLRLGSPATTDGGEWWLTSFLNKADARDLRVDFVGVHFYRGGMTPTQAFWWLAGWHDRTGRNLWVTEFNNGATWTCCKPTQGDNAWWINTFIGKLERAYFIERYSVYNWLGSARAMVHKNTITPAGKRYRDRSTTAAYKQTHYFYVANRETGTRLHVAGDNVELRAGSGEDALWSMDRIGRHFHLRHKVSGRYAALGSSDTVSLVPNTRTNAATQWKRKVAGEEWFFLINKQSKERLNGKGGTLKTVPETWDGKASQWQFQFTAQVGIINN